MAAKKSVSAAKPGLYANIQAKRERIAECSGETMRKKGAEGAPEAGAFRKAGKTAKKNQPHPPTQSR
jgi:hypothetical protein